MARASLALPGGADDDRAYALVRAANVAVIQSGELESAADFLTEAESLFAELDDGAGLAEMLACRSLLALRVGDYDEAVAYAEKQRALARELGDSDLARFADLRLADALSARAMETEDRAAAERSRAIYRALERELLHFGSKFEEINISWALSCVEFAIGDYAETISLSLRGLRGLLDLGVERAPDQLLVLGWAASARGETTVGVKLVSTALREYREDGISLERWVHVQMERFERSCREALGDAEYEDAVRAGEALSNEEAIELALGVSAT